MALHCAAEVATQQKDSFVYSFRFLLYPQDILETPFVLLQVSRLKLTLQYFLAPLRCPHRTSPCSLVRQCHLNLHTHKTRRDISCWRTGHLGLPTVLEFVSYNNCWFWTNWKELGSNHFNCWHLLWSSSWWYHWFGSEVERLTCLFFGWGGGVFLS